VFDVIIIGGGPAGLSAALVLGRARRRVLVCDSGRARNRFANHLHGYLTRDHTEPPEILRIGRQEIIRYGVEFVDCEATDAVPTENGFRVTLDKGVVQESRKLLLATGVTDVLPEIPGLKELYGRGIHHCPYCDGWERRDQKLIALGEGDAAIGLAMSLLTWSKHVIACTNGTEPGEKLQDAQRLGISVQTEHITRVLADSGELTGVEFDGGERLEADAIFFNTGQYQRSPLAQKLGCRFRSDGGVWTSKSQCTDVPGLYLAGDADKDVQFVIVAAAEGATAAVAINKELQDEDRARVLG
jgi:thioredoxin reductase